MILFAICVVAILLGFAALIGMRLPKTHFAASRLRLEAARDEVWDAVVDVTAYPNWRPGLARVEAGPNLDGRPTWYEYCRPQIKVQLQFTVFEPKTRLVSRIVSDSLPIFGTWEYRFEEEDGKTTVTITESDKIYNPLLRFFSRLVFPHHAAMDMFLIALAHYFGCEATPEHLAVRLEL
jgi:hypothetical protein